jgi:hypothetical protein
MPRRLQSPLPIELILRKAGSFSRIARLQYGVNPVSVPERLNGFAHSKDVFSQEAHLVRHAGELRKNDRLTPESRERLEIGDVKLSFCKQEGFLSHAETTRPEKHCVSIDDKRCFGFCDLWSRQRDQLLNHPAGAGTELTPQPISKLLIAYLSLVDDGDVRVTSVYLHTDIDWSDTRDGLDRAHHVLVYAFKGELQNPDIAWTDWNDDIDTSRCMGSRLLGKRIRIA